MGTRGWLGLYLSPLICCIVAGQMSGTIPWVDVKDDYELLINAYQNSTVSGNPTIAGIIPRASQTAPITVSLGMYLYAVMDFNAVEGRIILVSSLAIQWRDDISGITGTNFKGTAQSLFVSRDQIWAPKLVLDNSAEFTERIGDSEFKIRYNVSSGDCFWKPRMMINAACTPDMTFYPFDEQTCDIIVKPLLHDSNALILKLTSNEWNTARLDKSSVWRVFSTSSAAEIKAGSYVAKFTIVIKRNPLFLSLVIVLPVLLMSLMTGFLFLLPAGSGARVGFGITCFLSFAVLLQTLMAFLPEASSPMSLLCYYVIVMLLFSGVLSIVNIMILRLYFGPDTDNIPAPLQLLLDMITCKTCRRIKCRNKCPDIKICTKRQEDTRTDAVKNTKFPGFSANLAHRASNLNEKHALNNDSSVPSGSIAKTTVFKRKLTGSASTSTPSEESDDYSRSVTSTSDGDQNTSATSGTSWETIGRLLDMFFLITFSVVQTLFTVFFLVPIGARY